MVVNVDFEGQHSQISQNCPSRLTVSLPRQPRTQQTAIVKGFFRSLLILLCHKRVWRVVRWQQGQRGRLRAMARAIVILTDVIEFGT
jgi:hypothetical protein